MDQVNQALRCGGFWIFPALMQEVHTEARRVCPWSWIRIRCTLGFHGRFVRRCEKLTW